ncbi:MAG: cyclic-di-AMP receptor [Chloroflexi bacterium]|nr:cyclic-di-AMP receptor [Chloroflexota bacterium]MBU1748105.1 cyclic-di-AMP receptor [Chloroflexota bacterium]MBU1880068.1 cyclic-di-AMP receptor [Chloroflexota bacterium]
MRLVVAIMQEEDADPLLDDLMNAGYRATIISTTGGFLREGNATVLVGVERDKVPDVMQIIQNNCAARKQYVTPLPPIMEPGEFYVPQPVEVQVGGATVFVLVVDEFKRL